ncbi:MAG: ABC transporter permease [Treponema sp.]|jgi:sulfonate transport system permease protein|nr:ABC transporter permease [Treponema sp.]
MADLDAVIDTGKPKRNLTGYPIIEKLKIYANLLAVPVALVVLWHILAASGLLLEIVLPGPVRVVQGFLVIFKDGSLAKDLGVSALRVVKGYFWGVVIGLAIGVFCGLSKFMERLVAPLVDAIRQVPMMAWIPLIILWFGIGETSKTIIIAKSVFVPIFLNTFTGIRGVPKEYIEVAEVMEFGYLKLLFRLVLPSALPNIFTGLRLGAGFSWMAVVAAEMLGGLTGLGYALLRARDFLESDKLIALMIVIGIVGLILDRVLRLIEGRILHWRKAYDG